MYIEIAEEAESGFAIGPKVLFKFCYIPCGLI